MRISAAYWFVLTASLGCVLAMQVREFAENQRSFVRRILTY
eukprot:COSAG02_NODE_2159_length_9628_cov_7.080596_10_plen_41_part_00